MDNLRIIFHKVTDISCLPFHTDHLLLCSVKGEAGVVKGYKTTGKTCTNYTLPTGALDSETGCMVLSELQKLCRSEGKTVLVVTHNANIARAADRVIHIRSGEIKSIECCDDPCSVEEVEW